MYSIRKYVALCLVTTCFLLANNKSVGQKSNAEFNRDSSKSITLNEFNHRVDRATNLLQTKQLSAISDADHINIMMCLNTIFMAHVYMNDQIKARFEGATYKKLEMIADKKKYSRNIVKVYPKWIPNRGMGLYFPELKMELYGTPMEYAIFNVVE